MAGLAVAGRWFHRLGHHYILALLIVTRLSGWIGGLLVVYYVDLILNLPAHISEHFQYIAARVVVLALTLTTAAGLWETRHLRWALRLLHNHEPIDPELAQKAGYEAVVFPVRHHRLEAWLVPVVTLVPVLIILKIVDDISPTVMVNITIAVFMGIAMAELATFLVIERLLQPVIRYLLDCGLKISYDQLPISRLRVRLNVCFSIIIITTALMIGTLAGQRATDIIKYPEQQAQAVANLRAHATYITFASVVLGFVFSTAVAQSVTSRVDRLVYAMKRVEEGSLSERLRPTGNDDIDVLARQFNAMVEQLDHNDKTIRELNTTLEHKVLERTQQLSESKRELQKSLQQLQESDRLKTEFFANVSHELRTPLTMIVAPVERLLETQGPKLQREVLSMLDVVRINSRRLLELINRLLDFSKLEAGQATLKMTAVDLNGLVQEMVSAAMPLAAQRGIQLTAHCDPQVTLLGGDGEKIEIIIANLLSNALKFTPRGGSVRVETSVVEDSVCLSIQDSGIGIPEADLQRVFERFVQLDGSTSREFSGTGLGLPLVKEFAEMHGGQIQVTSQVGKGSTFRCYLPLTAVPQVQSSEQLYRGTADPSGRFSELMMCQPDDERAVSEQRPARQDAATILVADDTPEVRSLLLDILSEKYNVLVAKDGAEGCEIALRERPDLILSDVMMPNVDGYEFCRRMKECPETAQIPFIMLTAKAQRSMKIEGLEHGAMDYLVKPFDVDELRARVTNLLKLRHLHRELDQRNHALEKTLKELRETQSQLVHSEKMNSLGQLVAGLAHEINNAINAVYNGIHPLRVKTDHLRTLVAQSFQDPAATATRQEIEQAFEKVAVLASVIEEGAARTARIVSDMKTFSHPGSEAFAPFDIHQCLDMCLNLLNNQLKHRITVVKQYCADGNYCGPRGQLGQVFMNVLNNAQQAISGPGQITIATERNAQQMLIRIRDTGHGIPDEIRARVFDPFFTTKAPGVGTGLGLSISYGLVTKLGGSIQCNSRHGEGTEFVVVLPVNSSPLAAPVSVETPVCLANAHA